MKTKRQTIERKQARQAKTQIRSTDATPEDRINVAAILLRDALKRATKSFHINPKPRQQEVN